ncbi:7TM diverse intracellular signaling domain-containing protein [Polaribacter tangerinus]|uniref:7TM diverse intracellular signaling domain-containing protein n=1 Tax=Polaribacter tangerinus TaxID=1920034 RepID=UPI000B4B661F|nr:7TM diverse intracellular signaling domain-containing protein [Polaribacter tangerinus]
MFPYLLLIAVLLKSFFFSAQLSSKKENLLLSAKSYLTEKKITVNQIDSLVINNKIALKTSSSTYPISDNFLWIKFNIDWSKKTEDKIIEINNPFINDLVLYEKKADNTFQKIGFGGDKSHTFYERSHINRRFTFPLKNTQRNTSYYLMIDNRRSIMLIPIWLWNKKGFKINEKKENIFYLIYFSFILFIAICSMLLSAFLRKKIFFYYALYVLSLWLYLFTTLGFSFQYIYPNNTNITNDARYFLVTILIISAINFLVLFLKIKKYSKFIYLIFNNLKFIFLLFIIIYIYNKELFYKYNIALTYFFRTSYLILISCLFIVVFKVREVEAKRVKLFIISIFFVVVSFIIYIGIQINVIPHYWFSINPVLIGVGLEVLILSIALFSILRNIIKKNDALREEFNSLQVKINSYNKQKATNTNEVLIHLKSKAIINSKEIVFIKADGHYVEYYLEDKKKPEIDRNSLTKLVDTLPEGNFVRVHKSYIVNVFKIKIVNSTKIMLHNGTIINLSRAYKENLKKIISKV